MGLDIYLSKFAEPAALAIGRAEKYLHSPLQESDDPSAARQLEDLATELGLGEYGEPSHQDVQFPSARYPDHMFQVGYLRSSYNAGGINSVLRSLALLDLYGIFGADDRRSWVLPDWPAAADRARETIAAYRAAVEAMDGCRVVKHHYNPLSPPTQVTTSAAAAKIFQGEVEKRAGRNDEFSAYDNAYGSFFFGDSVPRLRGVVLGMCESLFGRGMTPCTYLIVQDLKGDGAPIPIEENFYYQALVVVEEMCDWVLAQPDADHYALAWSA